MALEVLVENLAHLLATSHLASSKDYVRLKQVEDVFANLCGSVLLICLLLSGSRISTCLTLTIWRTIGVRAFHSLVSWPDMSRQLLDSVFSVLAWFTCGASNTECCKQRLDGIASVFEFLMANRCIGRYTDLFLAGDCHCGTTHVLKDVFLA